MDGGHGWKRACEFTSRLISSRNILHLDASLVRIFLIGSGAAGLLADKNVAAQVCSWSGLSGSSLLVDLSDLTQAT